MPAYRSEAETQIRNELVTFLRAQRPGCRIIHEINASPFGNRIDVMAVTRNEVIACEIKSERDTLNRLPDQLAAMRGVAHHVIVAIHEKFLEKPKKSNGPHDTLRLPEICPYGGTFVFPERARFEGGCDPFCKWTLRDPVLQAPLPSTAVNMLWHGELLRLCGQLGLNPGRRATVRDMTQLLQWMATGRQLTLGICAALLQRASAEADPPQEVETDSWGQAHG